MRETELKLIVDPARAAAVDSALRRLAARARTIESRYFDTADRRLADAGLSLRTRRTGRAWEQTLKGPGGHAAEREEETVARPGRWSADGPPIDPGLHAGTPSGKKLLALLARGKRAAATLLPSSTSLVVRRSVTLGVAGARVEIAFDRGAIRAGTTSQAVCEVEYELESGSPAALVHLARAGVVAHGMCLSTVSKAARGDRLARGEAETPPVKARPPIVEPSMSGPVLLRAIVQSCLDQILGNASEIAAGHVADELVHELRVGLRRLRTAVRELSGLDPSLDRSWEASLTAAFRALGDYRDRTIVATTIQAGLAAAGSPAPTIALPAGDPPDPVAVVRAEAFQYALLDVFGAVLGAPPVANDGRTPRDPAGVASHIGSRLERLHRRLARSAKTFEQTSDTERHLVRKRLKRLRYVAELVAPLYRPGAVARYIGALKPAQDALGSYIDLVVGARMARDAAGRGDPAQWFNAGWLAAQLSQSAKRCERALDRAAKAKRFWKD